MITFKKVEKYGITLVIAVVGLITLLSLNQERKDEIEKREAIMVSQMKIMNEERQMYIKELKQSRKEMTYSINRLNETLKVMDFRVSNIRS
jgi:hypothetical protein